MKNTDPSQAAMIKAKMRERGFRITAGDDGGMHRFSANVWRANTLSIHAFDKTSEDTAVCRAALLAIRSMNNSE